MYKPFILTVLVIFTATITIYSQERVHIYYLNRNLEIVPQENAVLIGKGYTGKNYMVRFFDKENHLLAIGQYTDSTMLIKEGKQVLFENRKVISTATYYQNLKNGLTQKFDSLGRTTDSIIYKNNKALQIFEFAYNQYGNKVYQRVIDSIQDTLYEENYDSTGTNKITDYTFLGNRGIYKKYNPDKSIAQTDSLFTREEKEAVFPGETPGWRSFLEKYLNAAVPVDRGAPPGNYTVKISFLIATDGAISHIKAITQNGYGTEQEAIRIIKKSPNWIPAIKYGRNINARRIQPITFQVMR